MFDPDQIQKAVSSALTLSTSIPPDHRGAFVLLTDADEVKAVVAHKLNGVWAVTGYVDHPWAGGLDYGATVQATW